jgi:hypothetical protein
MPLQKNTYNRLKPKQMSKQELKAIVEKVLQGNWNEIECLYETAKLSYHKETNADFHFNSICRLIKQVKKSKNRSKFLSRVSPSHKSKTHIYVLCQKVNMDTIRFGITGSELPYYVDCLEYLKGVKTDNTIWFPADTEDQMVNISLGLRMLQIHLVNLQAQTTRKMNLKTYPRSLYIVDEIERQTLQRLYNPKSLFTFNYDGYQVAIMITFSDEIYIFKNPKQITGF